MAGTTIFWNFLTQQLQRGARGMHSPPPTPLSPPPIQILSISCSFWEIFGKIVCCHPHLGEILDPPLLNVVEILTFTRFSCSRHIKKTINLSHSSRSFVSFLAWLKYFPLGADVALQYGVIFSVMSTMNSWNEFNWMLRLSDVCVSLICKLSA